MDAELSAKAAVGATAATVVGAAPAGSTGGEHPRAGRPPYARRPAPPRTARPRARPGRAPPGAAAATPDRPALVAAERVLRWAELDRAVDGLAAGLAAGALQPGDRVGLLLANSIEFVVAYFGILRAGLVALPLNTAYTADELGYQLEDSQTRLVVTDEPGRALAGDVPTLVVGSAEWDAMLATAAVTDGGTGAE